MSDETRPAEEIRADLAAEVPGRCDCSWTEPHSNPDCDFPWREEQFRASRQRLADDVQPLLRECAELREERDRLSERLATHDEMRLAAYAATERDKARAELEALRQRIAAQR